MRLLMVPASKMLYCLAVPARAYSLEQVLFSPLPREAVALCSLLLCCPALQGPAKRALEWQGKMRSELSVSEISLAPDASDHVPAHVNINLLCSALMPEESE